MIAFKKINSDPVINNKSEIQTVDPTTFRFLSNLYWPIAQYGLNLDEYVLPFTYPVWPSIYYNSQSLLYQDKESTKYFLNYYAGNMIPVNDPTTQAVGDYSPSFYIEAPPVASSKYRLFFVPTQNRVFSVAWAHYAGSGGLDSSFGVQETYPTKAIYNQVKMTYDQYNSEKFYINGQSVDHFFYVTLDKKTFSGSIVPNSFLLPLMGIPPSGLEDEETSQPVYTFTDYLQELKVSDNFGRYSYLVSGSLTEISSSEVFGIIYYDQGAFLLNSEKLKDSVFYAQSIQESYIITGSTISDFTTWYLSGSQSSNSYMLGRVLRNSQYKNNSVEIDETNPFIPTDFKFNIKHDSVESVYFLDINYDEFNYTNNPSCFVTDVYDIQSNLYGKKYKYADFKSNPVTYITTIGLYNDFGELIAVGKLPYPLKKDFSRRYSIKVVIKY